jgi:hypothetical protein
MISLGRTLNLKRIRASAILFLLSLLVAGCATAKEIPPVESTNPAGTPKVLPPSTSTSAPTTRPEPSSSPGPGLEEGSFVVTLETGESFNGEMRGHGATAIILANMGYGTESQWAPLYETLDKDKYAIITYPWLYEDAGYARKQTEALFGHLRSAGFERVICVGASLGASACGSLADQPEVIGLVLIAGAVRRSLAESDVPKLFIAGEGDRLALVTKFDYERASEPKEMMLYPTDLHGTDMFNSDHGDEFLDLLQTFIVETAASAP